MSKETYTRELEKLFSKKETYKGDLQRKCKETYGARYIKRVSWGEYQCRQTYKRDLQKRPTKETYKRDVQRKWKETYRENAKRPTAHDTLKESLEVSISEDRPTKETYRRDLQKRRTEKMKRDLQKKCKVTYGARYIKRVSWCEYQWRQTSKRDLPRRPTKRDLQKRPTKETYRLYRCLL